MFLIASWGGVVPRRGSAVGILADCLEDSTVGFPGIHASPVANFCAQAAQIVRVTLAHLQVVNADFRGISGYFRDISGVLGV